MRDAAGVSRPQANRSLTASEVVVWASEVAIWLRSEHRDTVSISMPNAGYRYSPDGRQSRRAIPRGIDKVTPLALSDAQRRRVIREVAGQHHVRDVDGH